MGQYDAFPVPLPRKSGESGIYERLMPDQALIYCTVLVHYGKMAPNWCDHGAGVPLQAASTSKAANPVTMRAVIGIAALAIGLGLVSVIAANWDAVPGVVRQGIHFPMLAALTFWLWRRKPTSGMAAEAGLFVLGMLGLTFFGHLGQVYQTDSPLWQPPMLWLVLFAPSLLLRGTGWLTALLLMTVMIIAAWSVMSWTTGLQPRLGVVDETVRVTLALASPVLLAGLAAYAHARSTRPGFWRRVGEIALVHAVAGASLFAVASADGPWRGAFQAAVGIVAPHLVLLSFELGGDLLTGGAGFIASGLLILVVAWLALKI